MHAVLLEIALMQLAMMWPNSNKAASELSNWCQVGIACKLALLAQLWCFSIATVEACLLSCCHQVRHITPTSPLKVAPFVMQCISMATTPATWIQTHLVFAPHIQAAGMHIVPTPSLTPHQLWCIPGPSLLHFAIADAAGVLLRPHSRQ